MNILDKVDKSRATLFGQQNDQVSKRDQYNWATPGKQGVFMMISKHELNIDGEYQRDEVSRHKTKEIIRNWDWKLFGTITVVMRNDGSFWVTDGGNRTRASFYRDDITELPCMVFDDVKTIRDEAKTFIGAHLLKSGMTAYHRFRGSVKAENPTDLRVQTILKKYGYEISRESSKKYGFCAIGTLRKMVKEKYELADKIFGLCVEIGNNGDQANNEILGGLFLLEKQLDGNNSVFDKLIKDRLISIGLSGIKSSISSMKFQLNRGGHAVAARAILDLLNYKRRNRFTLKP